jgi:hypothetical protein
VNASVAVNPSINTNFTVTTVNFTGDGSQSLTVDVLLLSPSLEQRPLVGGAGTTGTAPIRVSVFATRGGTPGPVPNVSVRVREQDGSSGTLRCQEGTVFTNAVGEAVCTPVFGGRLGDGQFSVFVGGDTFLVFSDILFRVTVGPLAAFRITNGNNQSVNAGQALPAPLVAVGEDASGNAVTGADVVWELVSPNTGVLSNLSTVTDANGRVSGRLTAGSIPGTFQVRLRNPAGHGPGALQLHGIPDAHGHHEEFGRQSDRGHQPAVRRAAGRHGKQRPGSGAQHPGLVHRDGRGDAQRVDGHHQCAGSRAGERHRWPQCWSGGGDGFGEQLLGAVQPDRPAARSSAEPVQFHQRGGGGSAAASVPALWSRSPRRGSLPACRGVSWQGSSWAAFPSNWRGSP